MRKLKYIECILWLQLAAFIRREDERLQVLEALRARADKEAERYHDLYRNYLSK